MTDVLVGVLRLAHALAAATWVGGTFIRIITTPDGSRPEPARQQALREALRVGIGVFLLTGVILAVQRLGSAPLPPMYVGLLAAKIVLGLRMFVLARHVGLERAPRRPEREILLLGVVVYGIAVALRTIYEETIRP
jgi:putative copper export protein